MPSVTVTLHPMYDGDYARHGVEFSSVHFDAPSGTDPDWLELSLHELPGCATLVEFKFDPDTGKGSFILLDSVVSPGEYRLNGPIRHVLEVDGRIHHNGRQYGQIMTHIETEMWHALCGAEQGSTVTGRLENVPVTCPTCRERWQLCQVYALADFEMSKCSAESRSCAKNAKDMAEHHEHADAKKADEDAPVPRKEKWIVVILIIICLIAAALITHHERRNYDGLPASCNCMPG